MTLVLGTRGSKLALVQAGWVADQLAKNGSEVKLLQIKTSGDEGQPAAETARAGLKGLFTKEIHSALAEGTIDFAVHSLKDLPVVLEEKFELAAVPLREDPRDAWISREGIDFASLEPGSKVGTSSVRRASQLRALRSDLEYVSIRGNVDTRLRKVAEGLDDLSGAILAMAGLRRLGLDDRVQAAFETAQMMPAAGQGALALTCRRGDSKVRVVLKSLEHRESREAVTAERAFVEKLEGDCDSPIGAYASIRGHEIVLEALVASADGSRVCRAKQSAVRGSAKLLGISVARKIFGEGAGSILAEIKDQNKNI